MVALWWICDILHVFFSFSTLFFFFTFFYLCSNSSCTVLQGSWTTGTWTASLSAKVRLRQYTRSDVNIYILTLLTSTLTVITSNDLQKHGNIWVCPTSEHVCTRFLFVWVYGAFRSFAFGKTSVVISGKLHFPPPQVWERPGRRCPRQHSGSDDPERNLTSHLIKVMLTIKSVKWRRRSLISQKRGTNLTWQLSIVKAFIRFLIFTILYVFI